MVIIHSKFSENSFISFGVILIMEIQEGLQTPNFSSIKYHLLLDKWSQYKVRSLPDTWPHDLPWELN